MGSYHIELSPREKHLCTTALSWGNYEHQKLPMVVFNSPIIFQKIYLNSLRGLIWNVCIYMTYLLKLNMTFQNI